MQSTTTQSVSTSNLKPVVEDTLFFTDDSDKFPDLRFYYDKMCGNATQVGHFLQVDLDHDGLKDIVMTLWCDLNGYAKHLFATPYTGPIPNTLLILKQKQDKTFYVANKEYFNEEIVPLNGGGTNGLITSGDYNNDGKVDVAFAFNKEDGRAFVKLPNGTTTWDAYPQVLMSTPKGFELQTVPLYFTNNYIHTIKNANHQDELLVGGNKFIYKNNKWQHVDDFYKYANFGLSTVNYQLNNTQYIFTDVYEPTFTKDFGLALYKVTDSGYTLLHRFVLNKLTMVEWYDPQQKQFGASLQPVITLNNKNYLTPAFANACYAGTKNNVSTFYALFHGIEINNYVPGQRLTLGVDFSWSQFIGRIVKISVVNENITNVETVTGNISYSREVVCHDVNNDQTLDFFVNRWHTTDGFLQDQTNPAVFLNKNNTFVKIADDKFIQAPKTIQLLYSYMVDMNQDGLLDLVYTTHGIVDQTYKGPIRLQVYTAKRTLE